MIIGLVGKPSSGKSSFFKAATLSDIPIANYPFTTITKNEGVAFVSIECVDKEFGVMCNPRFGMCENSERFVPIQLIDVAGLVKDAHLGRGKGNAFLDDLNQADALIHVIDISGSVNEQGEPCEPLSYDPLKDVHFLEDELDYWYLKILKKGWEKFSRQILQEKQQLYKAIAKQMSGVRVTEELAEHTLKSLALPHDPQTWTEAQLFSLARTLRINTKPMIIAANKIDIPGAEKNLERLQQTFAHYVIIPCSAASEIALKEANKKHLIHYVPGHDHYIATGSISKEQESGLQYIQKNVLERHHTTGVQPVLNSIVFEILKYKAIFPGGLGKLEDKDGRVLPDCFLLPEKATALDFAFYLHTDIGKGFVKAIDVKTRLPIGKEHVLKHRDVIEIKTRS